MLDPKNFSEEIKSEKTTLVEFGAAWCMPCKMMKPVLADLAKDYRIVEIDCDEFPVETSNYNISSVPTLLFFKNGQMVKKMVGSQNKAIIVETFRNLET